jgi:hypothetical protein
MKTTCYLVVTTFYIYEGIAGHGTGCFLVGVAYGLLAFMESRRHTNSIKVDETNSQKSE